MAFCPTCRGDGHIGVFGSKGFGILKKSCQDCNGTGANQDPNRPVQVDDFVIERIIGRGGAYGVVVLVRTRSPNVTKSSTETLRYAMQMQNTDVRTDVIGQNLLPSRAQMARHEKEIWRNLEHSFIVRLAYFFELPADREWKDVSTGKMVADSRGNKVFHQAIVTEFVSGGNLETHVFENSPPAEGPTNREQEERHPDRLLSNDAVDWICRMRRFGAEMCAGLNFLHSSQIIYRDLKPTNVLLKPGSDGELHICFTDFKFSFKPGVSLASLSERPSSLAGSPLYAAPEVMRIAVMQQRAEYTPSVDLYSLGRTLLVCLNRERLADSPKELKMPAPETYATDPRVPEAARRFVERLTSESPQDRGTSDTLGADPFFTELKIASVSNRKLPAIDWVALEQV